MGLPGGIHNSRTTQIWIEEIERINISPTERKEYVIYEEKNRDIKVVLIVVGGNWCELLSGKFTSSNEYWFTEKGLEQIAELVKTRVIKECKNAKVITLIGIDTKVNHEVVEIRVGSEGVRRLYRRPVAYRLPSLDTNITKSIISQKKPIKIPYKPFYLAKIPTDQVYTIPANFIGVIYRIECSEINF